MVFNNYHNGLKYLQTRAIHSPPGVQGLQRMGQILEAIHHQESRFHVVHVAGTSGKGSTCYLISGLLQAHGFKVGLHMSPHITDYRERLQINGQFISEADFVTTLNTVISKLAKAGVEGATFFELVIAMVVEYFAAEKVDFAVIETGLGGLLDATNALHYQDKTAVITRLGLDHTHILGSTIEEIAAQKAGIIHSENDVICLEQEPEIMAVINSRIQQTNAKLHFMTDEVTKNNYSLGLEGSHQEENANLALTTLNILSRKYRFKLQPKSIRTALANARLIGRFDEITANSGQKIILDGAHNPQKMQALIRTLKSLYPDERFTFLLGIKDSKNSLEMLRSITSVTNDVVLTTLRTSKQDLILHSTPSEKLAEQLRKIGKIRFQICPDTKQALKLAQEAALHNGNTLVITGSFYLLADTYRSLLTSASTKSLV